MTLRTKNEQKAYFDGYKMCAECIEKYLSDEGKKRLECLLMAVRNAVEIEDIEPKMDDMTSSHSELDIYKGCIDLMNDLLLQVYEWLEIVGIDVSEMDEDEQFATHFYTTEIVERLFLWKTSHSGGTSQRMKLKELGITDDAVLFDFAKMFEPQESEDQE